MYLPRRFAETDLAELDKLVARDAFVTLVTVDADGMPFASHLPVLYARNGASLDIRGHWARPNPQARHAGPTLMIVHGPHAYVSPSWYLAPQEHVPTWNYAVAHLHGRLEITEDSDALAAIVSELSAKYETPLASGWVPRVGHADFEADLRGIVGFTFVPERIALKFKLNQNHPEGNVRGAIEGLRRGGGPQQHEVADLMAARLARRDGAS